MGKIDFLLEKLDNKIPQSLAKKIDKLDDLQESLEVAQQEYNSDPSEENKTSLDEANDYIEEFELEIIEQLETLVDKKLNDAKTKEVEAQKKATEVKTEKPKVETPKVETPEDSKEDKKESSGVLGLVIGGILLVGSLGAINYFKNNR